MFTKKLLIMMILGCILSQAVISFGTVAKLDDNSLNNIRGGGNCLYCADTSICSYTLDTGLGDCVMNNIDDLSCKYLGVACEEVVADGPGLNQVCSGPALPSSNCVTLNPTYCVETHYKTCQNGWIFSLGIVCQCKEPGALVTSYYRGSRTRCS